MNINLDIIKSHTEELIKIIEEVENKLNQHALTQEEFLQFLDNVKEKNSFILEELGEPIFPYY